MSRDRVSGSERLGVANFVHTKMSYGFQQGEARPANVRQLSEREIKAANARIAVPALLPPNIYHKRTTLVTTCVLYAYETNCF